MRIVSAIMDIMGMGPGPGFKQGGSAPWVRGPGSDPLWLSICASMAIDRQSIGNSKGPRRDNSKGNIIYIYNTDFQEKSKSQKIDGIYFC